MIAFGPITSRRLGRCLGISNIPTRLCTYSCVHCAFGADCKMSAERVSYYSPEDIYDAVVERLERQESSANIDYLLISPDGEPTLDMNLDRLCQRLRNLGIKLAISTNTSLMDMPDVRYTLSMFDVVLLKVDAVSELVWRELNRPHRLLDVHKILNGCFDFTEIFEGKIFTDTRIISGYNDGDEELHLISDFLSELDPDTAFITASSRVPKMFGVVPGSEDSFVRAYNMFKERVDYVELLLDYTIKEINVPEEGRDALMQQLIQRPLNISEAITIVAENGGNAGVIGRLVKSGELVPVQYNGEEWLMKSIHQK